MNEDPNYRPIEAQLVADSLGPTCLKILDVVTLYPDGRVELAEGIDYDEAARKFWVAVDKAAPGIFSRPTRGE